MSSPLDVTQGGVPFAIGVASVVRIPVPGTNGLCIELSPRGYVPPSGSTSTLFFQDASGKRVLRLDYGYNVKTKTVDYHWNQKGTFKEFGIADHTPVGGAGRALYTGAKYFRYFGRTLLIVGAAVDIASIAVASKPIRRASEVVSAWALAWAGCRVAGPLGAEGGAFFGPEGAAVGGIGACIIGGYVGYRTGDTAGDMVYDWGDAIFTPLPQVSAP